MQRALNKNPEDSTKHLPRYALRPTVEAQLDQPELREKLNAKLQKQLIQKIEPYKKLARTGAELAGEDPDEALFQLLSGTKYLSEKVFPQKRDALALEVADALAEGLHTIAENFNSREDIVEYFTLTERQRLVPHPRVTKALLPRAGASLKPNSLPFRSRQIGLEQPNDPISLSRLPRVYVGSTLAADTWLDLAVGFVEGTDDGIPFHEQIAFPVRCVPTWDIYIAIGPFGSGGRIVPILSLVARTRVRPAGDYTVDQWSDGPHDDDPQLPLLWRWMTIGEFDGHERQTEVTLRGDRIESHYDEIHFEDFVLSSPRADNEASLAELEAAAADRNRQFWEGPAACAVESEPSSSADADPSVGDDSPPDASRPSDRASTDDVAETPKPLPSADAEPGNHGPTAAPQYRDLPPADWGDFADLHIELRSVSADELVDLFTRPTYQRWTIVPPVPADLWTDERLGATAFDNHSLRDAASREVPGTPALAPEGTLLALLERWWRGEVRNRKPLREEIEETVREAVQRLDDYIEYARASLRGGLKTETQDTSSVAASWGDNAEG
jgi:hypothetical protein